MMILQPLNLETLIGTHRCGQFSQDDVDVVDGGDVNSESEQVQRPVHTQKLAHPINQKNKP